MPAGISFSGAILCLTEWSQHPSVSPASRECYLRRLLPADIHERCSGRAFVAVTTVFPRPRGLLVSEFSSRDDLIAALLTSCHIPW